MGLFKNIENVSTPCTENEAVLRSVGLLVCHSVHILIQAKVAGFLSKNLLFQKLQIPIDMFLMDAFIENYQLDQGLGRKVFKLLVLNLHFELLDFIQNFRP